MTINYRKEVSVVKIQYTGAERRLGPSRVGLSPSKHVGPRTFLEQGSIIETETVYFIYIHITRVDAIGARTDSTERRAMSVVHWFSKHCDKL